MHYKTRHELRCTCSRRILLAFYGMDRSGKPYVHMRATKAQHIIQEIVVEERGIVKFHCRECLRWTRITLVPGGRVAAPEHDVPVPEVLRA